KLLLLAAHEVVRLVAVVQAVEFADGVATGVVVVAVIVLRLVPGRGVARFDVVFPVVEPGQRVGGVGHTGCLSIVAFRGAKGDTRELNTAQSPVQARRGSP